jgi:glycerophosphoryl diester phosphodiesterase
MFTNIDIQGHRGCRGLLPENSIPAFIKALELGVTTLELDLAVTKDKVVVISHEPWLSHEFCSDLDGKRIEASKEKEFNIYALNYEALKKYDCGSLPHPRFPNQQLMRVYKPSLAEMIDSVKSYCKNNNKPLPHFNIEIKREPEYDGIYCPPVEEFCELVLKVIKDKGIESKCNLQSFDWETLRICHKLAPHIPLAMLVENNLSPEDNLKKLGFTPEIYSPYFKLIDAHLLEWCRNNKIKLIPWTVNEPNDIMKVLEMGVDGIISDYPDRVILLLQK